MEDEEGYMTIEPGRRDSNMQTTPKKTQGFSSKCCKSTVVAVLIGSIAVNVGLIVLLIAYVSLDPDTAHPRLVLSSNQKSVKWGKTEQSLPNNTQRFDRRVWVLGQKGFTSGKHCWEVEVKGQGEWAVGVAKQSVQRKGLPDFSTQEGIWGMGEYWGLGNYVAFTSPQHTPLSLKKKPRRVRVFLDYAQGLVEFFNPEAKASIYTFSSASFSWGTIYPWFRVWEGTELILHP